MKDLISKLVFIFSLLLTFNARGQDIDSSHMRISLLTCGAGADLYSVWGHTAIRITDTTTHSDKIYNYGTFDFYDPDFYLKFVKGKLVYYLNVEQYEDFLEAYKMEDRTVREHELYLSTKEKLQLQRALDSNAREENKYYNYDFLFDNCATRVRDILLANIDGEVKMQPILPEKGETFRDLIYHNLTKYHAYWGTLGIDFLLGSGMDRKASDFESMFLPDYLYTGFDGATVNGKSIIKNRKDIYTASAEPSIDGTAVTPFLFFSGLLLLWVIAFFATKSNYSGVIRIMDFTLFFILGLLGILLVVMWTATNHQLCRNNLNLLWAIPFHSIAAFSIIGKKQWAKRYWLLTSIFCAALLLFWAFLPQHLNTAFIPVVILLAWRSWVQYKRK